MCGIFGVVGVKENAAKVVLSGLKKLEYRGYDSWGIAIKKSDEIKLDRHVGKIGDAKTSLPSSSIGLGHTRWATHGGVTVGNSHPHLDCTKKICLVHNGIVENFRPLKQKLLDKHKFKSETDTEVALHLVEEKSKTMKFDQAVKEAFKEIHGMNALILINANNDELIAVKNGSPLSIGIGKKANYISSDVWALLDHTNKIIFLEDNQMAKITAEKVEVFNLKSNKVVNPKVHRLNWQQEKSHLGRFHHYMEKEIFDQPKILAKLSKLDKNKLTTMAKTISSATNTHLLGCGTAYYAALFGEYLLESAGYQARAIVGSEFDKVKELLNEDQAFLMLSQSGETIDVVEAVDLAKKKNIKIMALTNTLGSTLYRKADSSILLQAGQEVAVASTKAFTAKLAILIQLYYCLNNELKLGQELISKTATATAELLGGQSRQTIKDLATKIKDVDHLFVVGRMLSYPIALETALKIKEVSYIHAEGYPGGELKHGPIALIDQGTPCIVIAPNDKTLDNIISAAHEMKARGGYIIGVSPKANSVFDFHLPIPDLKEATAIINAILAQLLAYDLSIARGLDPDKPRNLAKSVTVK